MSRGARTAVLLYLAALAGVVLSPVGDLLHRLTVRLYVLGHYDLGLPPSIVPEHYGFVLNIVLFVPLGLLARLALGWCWWRCVLAGAVLSGAVEIVQLIPLLGRVAAWDDVLANTLGAALGAAVGVAVVRWRGGGRRAG